jgi:polyisoprenoid-binding protein YceI
VKQTAAEADAQFVTDTAIPEMPGFIAGAWDIDPNRSEVAFELSHFTVSKARGRFGKFTGVIVIDDTLGLSSVTATIDAATITTGNSKSDRHVRSERFLDVEQFPAITFRSTAAQIDGPRFLVEGDLTIRGRSRSVRL